MSEGVETDGLLLESGNGLHLGLHVVIGGLERLEELFSLRDDVLVLDQASVVLEVDFGLGFTKLRIVHSSFPRALSERRDGRNRFYTGPRRQLAVPSAQNDGVPLWRPNFVVIRDQSTTLRSPRRVSSSLTLPHAALTSA